MPIFYIKTNSTSYAVIIILPFSRSSNIYLIECSKSYLIWIFYLADVFITCNLILHNNRINSSHQQVLMPRLSPHFCYDLNHIYYQLDISLIVNDYWILLLTTIIYSHQKLRGLLCQITIGIQLPYIL